MSTRVCGRCRRPLPVPSEGGAPAACPFCAAQDAGRGGAARAAQSRPPADAGAPKKRAEAFASALVEDAGRTTPVHSFAVPTEAIPVVQPRKREAPRAPTPPPVVLAPPPEPVVTILPPAAAPSREPPPAPPPRRAAAVTATLASLGPGPFTPQSRPGPAAPVIAGSQASPSVVAAPAAVALAGAPAAALAAAYVPAAAPAVAPSVAPHLVPVPTPSPAPIATAPAAAAPAPKALSAASLAATMLALSPEIPETPPPVVHPSRAAAPAPASAPATRGADAWNISSYLDGGEAPIAAREPLAGPAPPAGAVPDPQPSFDLPVDLQIRGGLSAFLHRLPTRGIGLAAVAALVVLAISAGAFLLLGGSHRSARTVVSTTAPAKAPAPSLGAPRVAAAPAAPARLPSLVVPPIADPPAAAPAVPKAAKVAEKIEKAEKPAKLRDAEPDIAPPAVEAPAPHASPSRHHAHAEANTKAVAKHAARHATASPKHGGAHHRTVARAHAAEHSDSSVAASNDSDKMARARDAYREGNERLFRGDAAGAITAYEEMVRLNPKDPAGYRGLGLASAQLGKRTEAVRYLRAYLKHAPNADDRGIIISRISLLQTLPQ